jgi:uncharacterized membrane protein YqjE
MERQPESRPAPSAPAVRRTLDATNIRTPDGAAEPSIGQLVGDLVADAQHLLRQEIELAKSEIQQELRKTSRAAVNLGAGSGVLLVGAFLLTLMLVHLLIDVAHLSPWVSYLVVGGLLTVVGVILVQSGKNRLSQITPMPRETLNDLRKDKEWIREQIPSNKI